MRQERSYKTAGHNAYRKKTEQRIHGDIQHKAAENPEYRRGKLRVSHGNPDGQGESKVRLPQPEGAAAHYGIQNYQGERIKKPAQKNLGFHFPCISDGRIYFVTHRSFPFNV